MASDQTINIRPPLWLPVTLVVIGGLFFLAGKNMEVAKQTPSGTIVVNGEGKASVTPNIAEVNFGVDTGRQATTAAAMKILSDKMNAIYPSLQKSGIDKKDIATQNLSLNPVYDWSNGMQNLLGYQAMQNLQVKVRDLDKASSVVTAAANAGANQVGGVNFTVDNPEAARADARAKAIQQARQKAEVLASQLGVRLGKIVSFSEGGNVMPPIMYGRDMAVGMGGGGGGGKDLPLPSGEQEIFITVSISYELN